MSDQETELEFWDDEPKKPTGGENTASKKEDRSSSHNRMGNDGYKVVHRDTGEAKGASGEIVIETAVKGLMYRCEVFKSGALIDAREISCKELSTNPERDYIFKNRYMATHNTFKMQYIAEEFFKEVDSTEGDFKDGEEEHCKVVTSVSDDIIRTIIYVDGDEFEIKEIAIKDNIKNKKNLLDKRCELVHLENVEKYIDSEKFPVNTFLNPILKKLPFYKKNPMHSFYLFLVLVVLILVILKFVYCMYLGTQKDAKLAKNNFAEGLCHTLENRCMESKESGWAKGIKPTRKQCVGYRYKTHIFNKEVYDKLFPMPNPVEFAKECKANATNKWEGEKGKELKETCLPLCKDGTIPKDSCVPNIASYSITPKVLRLSLSDSEPIRLQNKSSDTLVVSIEEIKMDDATKPEEIIYVVNRTRTRTLEAGEEDAFRIRLEHSAIQDNFENAVEYTGVIKLQIGYNSEIKYENIRFKFTLDI